MALQLAHQLVDLANSLGHLGGVGTELVYFGIFAKIPNAAKHPQLGQVTPSHTK